MSVLGNIVRQNKKEAAAAPPAPTVTAANNGTSLSGTTVQLGQAIAAPGNPGALLSNREIPMGAFSFSMFGTNATNSFLITNTGNGKGIIVTTSVDTAITGDCLGNATAIGGTSVGGVGLSVSSQTNSAGQMFINPPSDNIVATSPILILQRGTSAAGGALDGIGGSLDFNIETTDTGLYISNQIISKWVTAATLSRGSKLIFTGVSNAALPQELASFDAFNGIYKIGDISGVNNSTQLIMEDYAQTFLVKSGANNLFSLAGTGATRLNQYGIGTFTGVAAYTLQVDASGNIIEGAAAGGGWGTTGTVATLTGSANLALATNPFAFINSGKITIQDNAANEFLTVDIPGGDYALGDYFGVANGVGINLRDTGNQIFMNANINTVVGSLVFNINAVTNTYKIGDLNSSNNGSAFQISDATEIFTMTSAGGAGVGGITTNAPSANGAGLWLLGKINVSASVLDATQYLEAMVDGVLYKLALAQ